ncbi:40996_t:CDS:2, partial [Gigaspora margarita]
LPKEIITEYFKEYENEVKELRVYGIVVGELNVAGHQMFKIRLEEIEGNIVVDILVESPNVEEFLIDLEEFPSNSKSSSENDNSDNSNETNSSIGINWKEKPITIDPREPLNYPCDMIQKLKTTYGSFISKVATIDNVYLIAASLWDRKPQCIIATASTIANEEEVIRVVKNNSNSSTVKFIRPKIFHEYSKSKGAIDINNQ